MAELQPDYNDIEEVKEFVQYAWVELATYAWAYFLTKGRGAIVLDFSKKKDAPSRAKWAPALGYLSEEEVNTTRWCYAHRKTGEHVAGYDPKTQVILEILHPDGEASCCKVTSRGLPPPEAFEFSLQSGTLRSLTGVFEHPDEDDPLPPRKGKGEARAAH